MRSKVILEELKAKAYTGETAALGDALGDMVHWLAAHREDLRGRDVDVLMSVCLALYKNELEKSWDVSIHDVPEASVPATILPGSRGAMAVVADGQDSVESAPEPAESTQTGVENAIEAMVALRRPAATTEAASAVDPTVAARRRRWTDSECWSLTLRTT